MEKAFTTKDGKQTGTVFVPESWNEAKEKFGKEQALADLVRGSVVRQQGTIRNEGKESKRALTKEAITKLKALDPELLKEAGLTDILDKLYERELN